MRPHWLTAEEWGTVYIRRHPKPRDKVEVPGTGVTDLELMLLHVYNAAPPALRARSSWFMDYSWWSWVLKLPGSLVTLTPHPSPAPVLNGMPVHLDDAHGWPHLRQTTGLRIDRAVPPGSIGFAPDQAGTWVTNPAAGTATHQETGRVLPLQTPDA